MELTILYYTHNRENQEFENKIIQNLVKQAGDIPIISVSQKPIDLGKNIYIGDVGCSYLNEWRQILIGAKEAKTRFVALAESDVLYPPDYFSFIPTEDGIFRYDNVWILYKDTKMGHSFRRKKYTEGAQICSRDYLINKLEEHLEGQPEWFDGRMTIRDKNGKRKLNLRKMPFKFFNGKNSCVSFKTGDGVRKYTETLKGGEYRKMSLPYWGNADELRKEYL